MTVAEIMSTRVVTVGMDDALTAIREIFERLHVHHLLVVEKDRLVGVITDRDLLGALSPYVGTLMERERDTATLSRRAHQIMSHKPITITADCTVIEAARRLVEHDISCLPVVSSTGTVEGIVTRKDLLRWIVGSAV